jgi:hypothetical protein
MGFFLCKSHRKWSLKILVVMPGSPWMWRVCFIRGHLHLFLSKYYMYLWWNLLLDFLYDKHWPRRTCLCKLDHNQFVLKSESSKTFWGDCISDASRPRMMEVQLNVKQISNNCRYLGKKICKERSMHGLLFTKWFSLWENSQKRLKGLTIWTFVVAFYWQICKHDIFHNLGSLYLHVLRQIHEAETVLLFYDIAMVVLRQWFDDRVIYNVLADGVQFLFLIISFLGIIIR